MADPTTTMRKLQLAKQYPDMVKELTATELADLVLLVLDQGKVIQQAIDKGQVDISSELKKEVDKAVKEAQVSTKQVTEAVNAAIREYNAKADTTSQNLSKDVQDAISRLQERVDSIKDGDDGEITEAEIERAASVALSMLDLPDFEAMVSEAINSDSEAIRNALELLQGEDRYSVFISDVEGLEDRLQQLATTSKGSPGGTSKQAVYRFINDAIADGIIASSIDALNDIGDVDAATPTDGYVLTWVDAESKWKAVAAPGASGGEANTASNVGTAGVGLFKAKSLLDLQFKKLNAGSAAVTITDDVANDEVDVDLSAASKASLALADSATQPGDALTTLSGDLPFTQIEQIATNRILGRSTAGTGDVEALADADARTIMGLATSDSPQFAGVNVGHATDTTITRISAGVIAVEGTNVSLAGHTHTASEVTDFDTEVANNSAVTANTAKLTADTTNVTAAGALMDSELTSIADVKALNQSVVSGASPVFATTNMTEGTDKNFVTDAEATVIGNTSGTNTGDEVIQSGAGAPATTPSFVGQRYIDTTADLVYIATGTATSADWDVVATATAGTPSKGSLLAGDGTDSFDELTVGTNGYKVVADSGQTLGVKWAEDVEVKAVNVESPTATEDIGLFFTDVAITVTQLNCVLRGSATPSVTWTLRHGTDRSATGAEVVTSGTTTTSTTTGSEVTSFNDATIVAGSWVWLETTAQSGTVDELTLAIEFTRD